MTYAQEGYRFRNDDQTELGASWLDAQDVPQVLSMRPSPGVNEPSSSGVSTPRRAGINVPSVATNTLFFAAHIRPFGLRTETIISRFDTIPNRCVHFMLRSDGAVLFGWSPDGTNVVDINSTVQWFSDLHSYPVKLGQSFWIGVVHYAQWDILRMTRFYVAPARELLLDHQLGAGVEWGNSGPVYDSTTAEWRLGLRIDGGFHFNGDIYSVEAHAIAGDPPDPFSWPTLLNPDFSDPKWIPGITGVTIAQGRTDDVDNFWTFSWDRITAGGMRKNVPFRLRTLSSAVGASSSYAASVAAAAPLAHWRFSGAGTADSVGNHTLTLGGGATPGIAGVWAGDEAVYFDGVDDFATVANETDLELVSDMSIEMWVRPHDATGSGQTLLSCRASGDPLYEIYYGPDTDVFSFYPNTSAGSSAFIGSGVENQWYHIVVTIDWSATDRTISTYLNGVHTNSLFPTYLPAPVSPVISIGRRSIANDLPFDGDISELAIYPNVLTLEQVVEHYQGGLTLRYKRVDEPDTEWRPV